MKLPSGPTQMMKKVNEAYKLFFRLWDTFLLPKLMKLNKWFDDKYQLQVGDIVYFRKEESELSSRYTVGKVVDIVKSSKDGLVRRVSVQYRNLKISLELQTELREHLLSCSTLMTPSGMMTWRKLKSL